MILTVLQAHLLVLIISHKIHQVRSFTLIILFVYPYFITKWVITTSMFAHIETNIIILAVDLIIVPISIITIVILIYDHMLKLIKHFLAFFDLKLLLARQIYTLCSKRLQIMYTSLVYCPFSIFVLCQIHLALCILNCIVASLIED
jgi:hypothetical protein